MIEVTPKRYVRDGKLLAYRSIVRGYGRVLFLGETSPYSDDPRLALFPRPGSASSRLCAHLELARARYLGAWRANLCTGRFDMRAARARATALVDDWFAPWDVVVMLGARVARACGYLDELGTAAVQRRPCALVSLPHPSGRCRLWNDPTTVAQLRAFVRFTVPQLWL